MFCCVSGAKDAPPSFHKIESKPDSRHNPGSVAPRGNWFFGQQANQDDSSESPWEIPPDPVEWAAQRLARLIQRAQGKLYSAMAVQPPLTTTQVQDGIRDLVSRMKTLLQHMPRESWISCAGELESVGWSWSVNSATSEAKIELAMVYLSLRRLGDQFPVVKRFKIRDRVLCKMPDGQWEPGNIRAVDIQLENSLHDERVPGMVIPYEVLLLDERIVQVPFDEGSVIKSRDHHEWTHNVVAHSNVELSKESSGNIASMEDDVSLSAQDTDELEVLDMPLFCGGPGAEGSTLSVATQGGPFSSFFRDYGFSCCESRPQQCKRSPTDNQKLSVDPPQEGGSQLTPMGAWQQR